MSIKNIKTEEAASVIPTLRATFNRLTDPLFAKSPFDETEKKDDPYRILFEVMYRQFAQLEAYPELTAILFQEEIFREYPEIRDKFRKHRKNNEEAIIKLIIEGQKAGIIDLEINPRIFALLYIGSIRISVLRWRNEGFSYSLKEEAELITRELFSLLKGSKGYYCNCK